MKRSIKTICKKAAEDYKANAVTPGPYTLN